VLVGRAGRSRLRERKGESVFCFLPGRLVLTYSKTIQKLNLLVVGDGACLPAVLGRYGGDTLLTTSMDVTAKLLSAESGECLRAVEGHRIAYLRSAEKCRRRLHDSGSLNRTHGYGRWSSRSGRAAEAGAAEGEGARAVAVGTRWLQLI